MERKKIKVYTKFDNVEKNYEILAIKNVDVIKYIDLENNIMIVNIKNNVIKRENKDYIFNIDFEHNNIEIVMKKLKKSFMKKIKVLLINKTNKSYLVRYLLKDEKTINEYYVNF